MSNIEDKQKEKFLLEINNNKKFLISILDSLSSILEKHEDTIDFKIENEENINYVEIFNTLETNINTINEKFNILNHQVDLNKQNILTKIDENKNWIENPFHSYEYQKNKHLLRFLGVKKINSKIRNLKKISEEI